jgi:transketolase
VSQALRAARADPRPSMLACRTVIAKGIARLQGQRGGHSARLFEEDARVAREQLGWSHAPFEVPEDVLAEWRAAGRRGAPMRAAWRIRVDAMKPADRALFERVIAGRLPDDWRDVLVKYRREAVEKKHVQGGILLSAEINDLLTDVLPERMVACADLEAPTSHKRRLRAFTVDDRGGAYVHCGVREHVMGAACNGIAAHGGVIPLAVTYLSFSDYERPAMRMAALMGLPVKFVFSHDSIGIGKNGPTHQPVEIIASLRAMPNMQVMRPADAVEAAECWEVALERRTGPTSLIFARQDLPLLRTRHEKENRSARGAYVLHEAEGGARRVTLLATGSEVQIAVAAREQLQARGIPTAVVSMPCWDLFEAQDGGYRDTVLGPGTMRVGVEAAMRFGWDRYLGERGAFVGMTGFGLSGPANELYAFFGITPTAVVTAALRGLG